MTASSDPARSVAWASALSATTTVACVLPAYLAGALAVQIGDELGWAAVVPSLGERVRLD